MKGMRIRPITALVAGVVLLAAVSASADQVVEDNVIVNGSMCVGFDCVNNEAFDTGELLRLKENNLRILFYDTSNSPGFPTNDWRIVINDTMKGGESYFAVEDVDGGKVPFTLEAGAPENALVVDASGRVGLGTASPSARLHVQGDAYVAGNLELGSSRAYKTDIRPVEAKEALEAVQGLCPVRYRYRTDPSEETLGFIAEDVPDLVAVADRKGLSPMDIVAVLTRVVQQQQTDFNRRISELQRQVELQRRQLDELRRRPESR